MHEIQYLTEQEYSQLGFRCGLEIHQQLDTEKKLFCNCPVGLTNRTPDMRIMRHMRPTLSELGEYDRTALMEFKTRKKVIYELFSDRTCTYEMDDTPPFPLNKEALKIAVEIALLLNCKIVDEVHVTRKQYLDGSIPTGFQRTAMVGVDGWIPYKDRKIRIAALTLEEDACREMSDIGHTITWKTDRLSTPLVEVITEADILSPYEVPEVNRLLGDVMRATGKVRRGIGSVRQDVNVSITGGTRVEIKGVSKLGYHQALTHFEALRQKNLLEIREELKKRGLTEENIIKGEVEITPLVKKTASPQLRGAIEEGGKIAALCFYKCRDIFNAAVQPNFTFADEVSGRVRVVACIDSKPNLLHSDEPGVTGLLNSDWREINKAVGAETDDLVVILFGEKSDVDTAAGEVKDRMKEALIGIVNETRQPFPDGHTDFERILPGPDRMYPDTDTPPTKVTEDLVDSVRKNLPELPWDKERRYIDSGLSGQVAYTLSRSTVSQVYDHLAETKTLKPSLLAHMLIRTASQMKECAPIDDPENGIWLNAVESVAKGTLSPAAFPDFIRFLSNQGNEGLAVEPEQANLDILSQDDLFAELDTIFADLPALDGMALKSATNLVYLRLKGKIGDRYDGTRLTPEITKRLLALGVKD